MDVVKKFVKTLKKFKGMIQPFLSRVDKKVGSVNQQIQKAAIQGISDVLGFSQIFSMFDKDNSGFIDFNEFTELCKYMGLFLNKEALLEIFS